MPVEELVQEMIGLRQRLVALEAAEADLVQVRQQSQDQAALLSHVSRLAINLMAAPSGMDPCVLVAENLRSITGALAVGVSCYDAEQQALTISTSQSLTRSRAGSTKSWAGMWSGWQIPVSEEHTNGCWPKWSARRTTWQNLCLA